MTPFERFWQAYPKKLSKIDALKVWNQMKKQYHFDTDKAISVVEAQKKSKDWIKNGGQYIPYAGTWLRAGGWKNEIEPTEKEKADKFSKIQAQRKREQERNVHTAWIMEQSAERLLDRGRCDPPKWLVKELRPEIF